MIARMTTSAANRPCNSDRRNLCVHPPSLPDAVMRQQRHQKQETDAIKACGENGKH
jgi:hypothetical protein